MVYQIGDRIGDYEIVDILGAGGMGKVYKVRNVISERVEAMKVLLPNLESDPDLADRFMREIKVQASLQHPNIATLHTALRIDNKLLMLIEFVEGRTLEAELRQGKIPTPKALDYMAQVLSALGYAHSHGVVHRDIKPANMMLTPAGTIKLMDFGIARLAADRRLTQTGRTVGSLYYMSPEQIQGALDLDARSDLYSLGVTLYELVTNRRPFQGDSDYSIMAAHLGANPVPPIQIDPSLPELLNEVILMAIAKDPGQRFQTADAFKAALSSVAGSLTKTPASATRTVAAAPSVAAPPPIPVAAAPTPQPSSAAPAPTSRRGLYMAIGSVVTVAVLAVAALQGPKLFDSSSAASVPSSTPETIQAQAVESPASLPEAVSEQPQTAASEPAAAPKQASKSESNPIAAPIAKPVVSREPVQRAQTETPPAVQTPSTSYASSPPPAQTAQQPSYGQQQSSYGQPQQSSADESARAEALQEARELLMMLGTRTNSAKSSLNTIKQQQARMGTNLRADILTAEQRVDFYLNDAEAALKGRDPARARKNLEAAERALEAIEKFLGR